MNIVGARGNRGGVAEDEAPGRRNYLIGAKISQWRRNVRLWRQVRFTQVIDGVDVVYHGGPRNFEYDLIIAPGTDAAALEISLTGADALKLDNSGNLIAHTAAGDIIQHRPVAFQMVGGRRIEIAAAFHLNGTRIHFSIGEYDHSSPLILDPVIDYSTWAPGTLSALAADASGAAYVAGQVSGPVLPVTPGAYQNAALGAQTESSPHLFVAKFSPDGSTLLYCTYLGGSASDTGVSIAVDADGNAVIGGVTSSTDFPLTPGAYLAHNPGIKSISFVSKLSADGSALLWSTLLPSTGLTDVALNAGGKVFALTTPSDQTIVVTTSNAIATGNAYRWLGELDANGANLIYATYVPGLQATGLSGGMTIRPDGTVWIAGTGPGVDVPFYDYDQYCYNTVYPPAIATVIGIDPNASRVIKSFSIGGSVQDVGTGLQFDGAGNLYLAGYTCSPDFPGIDASLMKTPYPYNAVAFLAKVRQETQNASWTATQYAWPAQIATDAAGNTAMLAGSYLYYFDSLGNQVWSTFPYLDAGTVLTMDPKGRIYAGMTTAGGNSGNTANGWASAPSRFDWKSPSTSAQGVMRILPNGGTLAAYPQTIYLDSVTPMTHAYVLSLGGPTVPQPFAVSTTTPWLGLNAGNGSQEGTVYPLPYNGAGEDGVFLSLNSGQLPPGSYDGSFTITSPTLSNSPLTIPVHAVVKPPGSFPSDIPLEIAVEGSGGGWITLKSFLQNTLQIRGALNFQSSTPWIVPSSDGTDALIDESTLHGGLNTGKLTVGVAGNPQSPFAVTLDVLEGALSGKLMAGPGALSFLAQPGDALKNASVALWSTDNVRKPFTATSEAPWLTVSPPGGSAPQILSIAANPAGLQPGTYSTHIDVGSGTAANRGARIPVTLTIQNNVPFNIDPSAVAFRQLPTIPYGPPSPIQLTLTSAQAMSYQYRFDDSSLLTCSPGTSDTQTLSVPGMLTLPLQNCGSFDHGGWENLEFTTSGGDVREIPLAVAPPTLYSLISPGGIVNGATFAPGPMAPGSIVAIFGVDLAASALTNTAPLPVPPGNLVEIFPAADTKFGLFYQGPTQWTVQVPTDMQPGAYYLGVSTFETNLSPPVAFTVAATAPYIFIWGTNHGAILNADNSLNTAANPAAAGSGITVYLTGQGAVSPPVQTGLVAPSAPLSYVSHTTTATVDGSPVHVSFAGLAPGYVGLCQVNLDLPSGMALGEHKLLVNIGGVNSNGVLFETK